jgi:hypothetical protein
MMCVGEREGGRLFDLQSISTITMGTNPLSF